MSYVIFLWKILTLRFARVLGVQRTWIRKASDRTFFALIAPPEEAASKKKTVPQKQHRLIDLIPIALSLL